MEPIVIGISGVSCGGKSLLCKEIVKKYPSSSVISMDDYYFWPDVDGRLQYPLEYNFTYANFEVTSAVNFDKLNRDLENKMKEAKKLSQWNKSCPVILIDGILIFYFRPLQRYFTKRYFLTLSKDIAEGRRRQRAYDYPDPLDYFEKYVWPYYVQHKESLVDETDIVYIDGSTEAGEIFEKLCCDLDNLIAAKKISI